MKKTYPLGAQATLFSNRVTDLIVPVLFGSKAGRAQYRFQNIDRARLQGLELGSRAALPQGFSLESIKGPRAEAGSCLDRVTAIHKHQ